MPSARTRWALSTGCATTARALDAALALAEQICANSPVAVRESLRVINRSIDAADERAWQLSAEAAKAVRASHDSREGIEAFLAKRAPRWTGN